MTHDNVWRAAAYMISEFRDDAAPQASRYANQLKKLGDPEGFRTWIEVAEAIEALLAASANEPRN